MNKGWRIAVPPVVLTGIVGGLIVLDPYLPDPLCTSVPNRVASFEVLDACIARTVERDGLAGVAVAHR